MNQPPLDATESYLQMLQRDFAQRTAEQNEVRRLRREIEVKKLQLELASLSAPTQPAQPKRQPVDTYEAQIRQWHGNLPPEARQAPRTMEEFINLLQGRTQGVQAHPGEVSRILNLLGWVRRRNWKADAEGRRLWWPPAESLNAS